MHSQSSTHHQNFMYGCVTCDQILGWRVWTWVEGSGSTLPHDNIAVSGANSGAGSGAWVLETVVRFNQFGG